MLINAIMRRLFRSSPPGPSSAGFTLVENMIALTVIAIGLAAVYSLNGQTLSLLRSSKDEACASQVLQQRVEQLRIGNWQRLTSPAWIRDSLLNAQADGAGSLNALSESVKVVPYNSNNTSFNTFTASGGSASAGSANASLLGENAVQIFWTVTWVGIPAGKTHTRQTVSVLAKGGVAK